MARAASVGHSRWLPTYGWWPDPARFAASVVVSPYHSALDADADAEFATVVRGYARSAEPLWEHDLGVQRMGEERVLTLSELDVAPPPPEGAVVEVHTVRLDREPKGSAGSAAMWIDAVSPDGGGYLIPTQPVRGARRIVARDGVQVVPGIIVTHDVDTEIVLLNAIAEPVEVRLVASSAEGLTQNTRPFTLAPFSAWHGSLLRSVPRVRRLLESSEGVGSLSIYSNHRLLPHFGFRVDGGPLTSLDHTAPIFGI